MISGGNSWYCGGVIVVHWHCLGPDIEVMWQSSWKEFTSRMGMVVISAQPGWR